MPSRFSLTGNDLDLDAVRRLSAAEAPRITVPAAVRKTVRNAANFVEELRDRPLPVYGITTGFGRLANVRIEEGDLAKLQEHLIVSHAAGVGRTLPEHEARMAIVVRANTLVSGHSGVRLRTLELLVALWNERITPVVPSRGSVCASGDLAPLAHIALTLLGKGEAFHHGKLVKSRSALKKAGLAPLTLGPKEGLALINGTSVATAILAIVLVEAQDLIRLADVAAMMTLEALLGSDRPFDERVHALRPHPGQRATAANLRTLLKGSRILPSHKESDHKVQDPYSLRCVPQVHGASRDGLTFARETVERELNAVTDNPLLFPEDGDVISAGNFHGQHVALAADVAAAAIAELASISERRIEQMVNPDLSNLPAFLANEPGLNSGFMMAQTTAAALVSENKTLAHPASVDSIPTSANQEDHVSMGMWAARKARMILGNVRSVLAIEFLAAAQALDYQELKPGRRLESVRATIREHVPHLEKDRYLARDIETVTRLMEDGRLLEKAGALEAF
ncbi:MAG: histidine ammonia-lyase [Planctomycetota bacterium]